MSRGVIHNLRTSLFCITLDPFAGEWKKLSSVLPEAKRRGLEVVVAMDDRCTLDDRLQLDALSDQLIPFKSPGHCEVAYRYIHRAKGDFILLVSDDEQPSEALWDLAANPPGPYRYGIPVIPIVNGQMYKPDLGIQERLFYKDEWRWVGGFEGHSVSPYPQVTLDRNPGAVIWHHHLEAPREVREAKAARYSALDPMTDHRARVIWEEHPEGLVDIPKGLQVPNGR